MFSRPQPIATLAGSIKVFAPCSYRGPIAPFPKRSQVFYPFPVFSRLLLLRLRCTPSCFGYWAACSSLAGVVYSPDLSETILFPGFGA